MANEIYKRLRKLPAVHEVLAELAGNDEIKIDAGKAGRLRLTNIIRQVLQKARKKISAAELAEPWNLPLEEFSVELSAWLKNEIISILKKPVAGLRPLINATGVIWHTNCGRALLSPAVAEFVREQACRYSNLEFDVLTGKRGSRYDHIEKLLTDLTGAEAAVVVNNNAVAVFTYYECFCRQ